MGTQFKRPKHFPNLAQDITRNICESSYFPLLKSYYPQEIEQLMDNLNKMSHEQGTNLVLCIIHVLEVFSKNCQFLSNYRLEQRFNLQQFIRQEIATLQSLRDYQDKYAITFNCQLDIYTFTRTSGLINTLQKFIIENNKLITSSPYTLTSPIFSYSERKVGLLSRQLELAKQLQLNCESIRSQIGSEETMPIGLAINFMLCLCQTLQSSEESLAYSKEVAKLSQCISQEINKLRDLYPELAQAGEELHNAMTNTISKKI